MSFQKIQTENQNETKEIFLKYGLEKTPGPLDSHFRPVKQESKRNKQSVNQCHNKSLHHLQSWDVTFRHKHNSYRRPVLWQSPVSQDIPSTSKSSQTWAHTDLQFPNKEKEKTRFRPVFSLYSFVSLFFLLQINSQTNRKLQDIGLNSHWSVSK